MRKHQYPYSAFVTGVLDAEGFHAELLALLRRDPTMAVNAIDELAALHRQHKLPEDIYSDLRRHVETIAAKQVFDHVKTIDPSEIPDEPPTELRNDPAVATMLRSDPEPDDDATLIKTTTTKIEQTAVNNRAEPLRQKATSHNEADQVTEINTTLENRTHIGSRTDVHKKTQTEKINERQFDNDSHDPISRNKARNYTSKSDSVELNLKIRKAVSVIALASVLLVIYMVSPSDVETVGVAAPIHYKSPPESKPDAKEVLPSTQQIEERINTANNITEETLEERLLKFSTRTKEFNSTGTWSENETAPRIGIIPDKAEDMSLNNTTAPPTTALFHHSLSITQLHQRALARANALRLEPSSDPDSATGYLKQMIEKDKNSSLIRETRAEIAKGYLALARQARKEGNWDRVNQLLEKAIDIRLENSVIY
ncbi:MAG: hypothetical protein KUG82_14940 [Pseudomonadales bacterium]|nr:hypothetical protein [Pseudomonadales bacterium]